MRDELLAYLLGDGSPEDRARIEQRLEEDPDWKQEFEHLRQCMETTDAAPPDEADVTPPKDLATRTCTLVQRIVEHSNPDETGAVLPASLSESRDPSSSSSRWSWADLTVGSGILLALVILALPALHRSREAARRLTCQNNLQSMGVALNEYAKFSDGKLPQIKPGENAGIFVVQLAERGILTREQLAELLVCPSTELADKIFSGRIVLRIPTRAELKDSPAQLLVQLRKHMSGSFAYRIGYVNPEGEYQQLKFVRRSSAPLLADAPSFSVAGFQSANHGGFGQNVLSLNGSVKYKRQCLGEECKDHMFLNAEDEHAAGLYKEDVVLMRSEGEPVSTMMLSEEK